MVKSRSKSAALTEFVEESEEDRPTAENHTSDADKSVEEETSNHGEEEEYEIEAILDAKHGAFPGGRTGYLVKWKGYSKEHNSWVDQEDAQGANEMIEEYWERQKKGKNKSRTSKTRSRKSDTKTATTSPDVDVEEAPVQNKRKKNPSRRKSKSLQPDDDEEEEKQEEKSRMKRVKSTPRDEKTEDGDVDMDDHEREYKPMDASMYRQHSWEKLVRQVDTIEKADDVLKVFFTLNDGAKKVEDSRYCAKFFPQKLIQFYESHLRWTEMEQ